MCGRIIRNQVRPFWEMDMIYVGMLDAVFLISERSRLLALERSEALEQARLEDEHLSGGGGVTIPVRFGLGLENKVRLSCDDRIQFGPGQTPLETIEKFRLALSRGINDNTLGLYTSPTQVFFAMEPVLTEEYRAYAKIISDCGKEVESSLDSSVIFSPHKQTWPLSPQFCRGNRDSDEIE